MVGLRAVAVLASILAIGVAATPATGAPCGIVCMLADGNSTLDVDHLFSDGVYSWEVDGVEQIGERHWFWARSGVGGSGAPGPEFRLDDEDTNFDSGSGFQLVSEDLTGNGLSLRYQGRGLEVDLHWILSGGNPGSGEASIRLDVMLTNISGSALDASWFEFADFDVNDNNNDESAVLEQPGRIVQTDVQAGVQLVHETTPAPTHWEIGAEFTPGEDDLLDLLNDDLSTELGDTGSPFGPGRGAEFAFQHEFVEIADMASITYTTNISVPEPSSGGLQMAVLSLLLFLSGLRRP